jgi:hypothetical protein
MAGPISEHSLSAQAIKEIIAQYGNKLKFIKTENNTIAVNQQIIGSPIYIDTSKDIEYDNFDGYDFIIVKSWDFFNRKEYLSVIRVNDIRNFVIAENETDIIDGFRC